MPQSTALDSFEWQYRAWEPEPRKRLVAIVSMALAGVVGLVLMRHPVFFLIGAVVVFVSTAEMFLPVKHRLDANEARQTCGISVTSINWADVKRLIQQAEGVRLSPFAGPHRLDAFRGVFLRYAGNKDEVLGKIAELWKSDANVLAGGTDDRAGSETDRDDRGQDSHAPDGDGGDPVL